MAIYGLTSGTFIVAGAVIATLLAVTYGTCTYAAAASPLTPAIRPATRPVRLTPATPPAEGERQTAGLLNSRHQIASKQSGAQHPVHDQPEEKHIADPVPSGSDVSAGTYTCTECGYELKTGSTESLLPCPQCSNGSWNTVTGGDSTSDPAS